MVRQEDHAAAAHLIPALRPPQDSQDYLVERRTGHAEGGGPDPSGPRTPGERWGRPTAAINPLELLTWWEGRGGRRPLSQRELARKLGVFGGHRPRGTEDAPGYEPILLDLKVLSGLETILVEMVAALG